MRRAWTKKLVGVAGLLLVLTGCSDSEKNAVTADSGIADTSPAADMSADAAPDVADTGAPVMCYEGWSGDSGCCLSGTAQAGGPAGCPASTFSEAECGRLDPVCESADVGSPADMGDFATALLDATNAARTTQQNCGAQGMVGPSPALTLNAQLAEAAQRHADDMALNGSVGSVGSDGSTFSERAADAGYPGTATAENTGWGQADATAVVAAFLSSGETCASLMSSENTELGAGYAEDDGGRPYYSQLLGHP